jgi:hypothetical protein
VYRDCGLAGARTSAFAAGNVLGLIPKPVGPLEGAKTANRMIYPLALMAEAPPAVALRRTRRSSSSRISQGPLRARARLPMCGSAERGAGRGFGCFKHPLQACMPYLPCISRCIPNVRFRARLMYPKVYPKRTQAGLRLVPGSFPRWFPRLPIHAHLMVPVMVPQ